MRKLYIVGLVVAIALIVGIVYADQMTLSTYYPAPFGVYNQMVVRTLGVGDNNNDGSINHLDAPDPNDPTQANDLWVSGSVGIGTPNPQAILDLDVSQRIADGDPYSGFLPPRMTDVQLAAIQAAAPEGSIAYDSTNHQLNYRDETGWQVFGGGGDNWTINGSNLVPSDSTWNIVIGQQAPQAGWKFEITDGDAAIYGNLYVNKGLYVKGLVDIEGKDLSIKGGIVIGRHGGTTHQLELTQNDAWKPGSNLWTTPCDKRLKKKH